MKQLMKNTQSVTTAARALIKNVVLQIMFFLTCILATALQSSSGMQSMDVIYIANINTCRYALRLVI
jgi:hypothetical protein